MLLPSSLVVSDCIQSIPLNSPQACRVGGGGPRLHIFLATIVGFDLCSMRLHGEMSFLTLFTADAAAAHGHEFSPTALVSRYRATKDTSSNGPMRRVSSTASSASTVLEEIVATPLSPPPQQQKKPPRTKTSYYLALPPPGSHARHRHCSRSERALLVQLQKVSNTARPLPTLDVLPSSIFGSKLKRVGQMLHGAGQQDIVFVESEQYGSTSVQEESDDEDDLSTRRVVASVSQGYRRTPGDDGKGIRTTMIRFDDGLVWEANSLATGGYEFVAHESNGGTAKVAKWLPKSPALRRRSGQSIPQRMSGATPEPEDHRRFQFSMLDNVTRKKPILAWMGRHGIDVLDRFPRPSLTSPPNSPSNTPPASVIDVDMSSDDTGQYPQCNEISVQLREFIVVTGTWIALREGLTLVGANGNRAEELTSLPSPTAPTLRTTRTVSSSANVNTTGAAAAEESERRLHRRGTYLAHQATTSDNRGTEETEVPQREKSVGGPVSFMSALNANRLARPFGRSAAPNIPTPVPERSPPSVRLVPPEPRPVHPVSAPPPTTPPSPSVGCGSRNFSGRNRHSPPLSEYPRISGVNPRGSGSPVGLGKEKLEGRRSGLRSMIGSIFKRSAET